MVVVVRWHFVDNESFDGKTFDSTNDRWSMWIHARDLNHNPPTIIAMIGMPLSLSSMVMVLLVLSSRKKQTDP